MNISTPRQWVNILPLVQPQNHPHVMLIREWISSDPKSGSFVTQSQTGDELSNSLHVHLAIIEKSKTLSRTWHLY